MLKLLKRLRDRLDPEYYGGLRDELVRLDRLEDSETTLMKAGIVDPGEYVRRVLTLRKRQTVILDQLGWKRQAAELRADTAMRWGWTA